MDDRLFYCGVALLSACSWALGAILWRRLGEQLSSFSMNLSKTVFGTIFLGVVLLCVGLESVSPRSIVFLALSGVLGIAIGDTFFFLALMRLGPRRASLMGALNPVAIAVSAALFLGERPTLVAWAVAALAIALGSRDSGLASIAATPTPTVTPTVPTLTPTPTQTPTLPAPLSGGDLPSVTISVTAGWNLIGSVSQALPASHVTSEPSGMITSQFFGYHGSYVETDTLEPGQGYWVKVSQSGSLTLSVSAALANAMERIQIVRTSERPPAPPDLGISQASPVPAKFLLGQNYPNPFNPSTVITYELPASSFVTLKVYNLLGQEVQTLVQGFQAAGYKSVQWDATNLSSGIYFYRLSASGSVSSNSSFSEVRKMVVLK